jgi:hypothetical protein
LWCHHALWAVSKSEVMDERQFEELKTRKIEIIGKILLPPDKNMNRKETESDEQSGVYTPKITD